MSIIVRTFLLMHTNVSLWNSVQRRALHHTPSPLGRFSRGEHEVDVYGAHLKSGEGAADEVRCMSAYTFVRGYAVFSSRYPHAFFSLGETHRAVEAPLGCAERGRKGPAGGAGSYTSHTTTRHAGVANPQYYHVWSCVTIRPWTLITVNYTRLG